MPVAYLGANALWLTYTPDGASTTLTIPSDCDCVVVSACGWRSGLFSDADVFTINGTNLTLVQKHDTSGVTGHHYQGYMLSPPTGSQTLVFNHSVGDASEGVQISVTYWKNVDATTPIAYYGYAASANSITLTAPVTDGAILGHSYSWGGTNGAALDGQTQIGTVTNYRSSTVAFAYELGAEDYWQSSASSYPSAVALILNPAAGGGINRTLNDSLSITDGMAGSRELLRLIQSNIDVLDTLNRNKELFRVIIDSITTTDQLSKMLEYFRVVNESLDMNDVLRVTREHSRLLQDSFDVSDLVSVIITGNLVRLLSDTITVSDSSTVYRTLFRVLTDSIALSDSLIRTLGAQVIERLLQDNISITDSLAVTRETFKSLLENIEVTDVVYRELQRLVVLSESIDINDNIVLDYARLLERLLQDTVDIDDTISIVLSIFTTSIAARLLITDVELKDIVSKILKKNIDSEVMFKDIDSDVEN